MKNESRKGKPYQRIALFKSMQTTICVLILGLNLQAQWSSNGSNIYYNNGNVGIGTTIPQARLSLGAANGKRMLVYDGGATSVQAGFGVDMSGSFRELTIFHSTSDGTDGDISFGKRLENSGTYTEVMRIQANGYVGIGTTSTNQPRGKLDIWGGSFYVTGPDFQGTFVAGAQAGIAYMGCNSFTNGIAIMPNGYVGIGTNDTKGYRFAVNGDAIFTKVKVKAYSSWPDYVFNSGYKLRSLNDVEQFLKQHHHLPEVPSAKEVEKNGLDVGDNQAMLLKKIEELTLYAIEQQKEIKELKQELKQVKAIIKNKHH